MNALVRDYSDDGNAVGHARYCLAWIDEQEGRYGEALATIDLALKSGAIDDTELAARLLFKTGKIRLAYLGDKEAAQRIFKQVGDRYPETKIARHPYVTAQTK